MQEQIQQLTTEMNNPKSDKQINHKNNTQINYENETQNIPSPPTLFSPRKCQILKYTHTTQLPKSLQAVFVEKRGLAKLELNEVIQLIQSIMQTITIFEKRFTTQCFKLLTENIYVQWIEALKQKFKSCPTDIEESIRRIKLKGHFKATLKRAELIKCDICLVSKILWHKRITPSFTRMVTMTLDTHW